MMRSAALKNPVVKKNRKRRRTEERGKQDLSLHIQRGIDL